MNKYSYALCTVLACGSQSNDAPEKGLPSTDASTGNDAMLEQDAGHLPTADAGVDGFTASQFVLSNPSADYNGQSGSVALIDVKTFHSNLGGQEAITVNFGPLTGRRVGFDFHSVGGAIAVGQSYDGHLSYLDQGIASPFNWSAQGASQSKMVKVIAIDGKRIHVVIHARLEPYGGAGMAKGSIDADADIVVDLP